LQRRHDPADEIRKCIRQEGRRDDKTSAAPDCTISAICSATSFAVPANLGHRPEELESALAGRPGRIDQAIEVGLPDEIGRSKLVRLYSRSLTLDAGIVDEAIRRTEGASAAFIKELMRRIAQRAIARDGGQSAISTDIDEALDDMLFAGGRLNVKLLGGAQQIAEA
jgi:hypothetical protein